MNQQTLETIRAAKEAADDLIGLCRKNGPLYNQNPRVVAQTSRNAKWLLNALATLRRELEEANVPKEPQ